MGKLFVHLMLLQVIRAQKHGADSRICSSAPKAPPGVMSKAMPTVSPQFSANVECVIVNKNVTTNVAEYYDYINNRGATHVLDSGIDANIWMDYDTNEYIVIYNDYCKVTKLSNSTNRHFFGYTKVAHGSTGKIFSAGAMLRMKNPGVEQVYMGTTSYRGIIVDEWRSCQYWDALDATMIISWYFNAQTEWDSSIGKTIPVGAHVIGNRYYTAQIWHPMEHYYNFYHFRQQADPSVFETPAVTCQGRKNTKPLPTIPSSFSLTKEIIDKVNETISYTQEFYDFNNKLAMYVHYRPAVFGENRVVHDFNSGVAYAIDILSGDCTAKYIDLEFDSTTDSPTKVTMKTPNMVFNLGDILYTYIGVKSVRDIDCDSWVGTRVNYPSSNVNSTVAWYFTGSQSVNSGIPVRFTVDAPDVNFHFEYNIYDFTNLKNEPDWFEFDVSACYINRNRRKFQLNFPVDFAKAVEANFVKLFKKYLLISLTQQLQISVLRVANIQIFIDDDIKVLFELLDVAPIAGNVLSTPYETPLSTAADELKALITKRQLFIHVQDPAYQIFKGMIPAKPWIEISYIVDNSTSTSNHGNVSDHTIGQETTEVPTQPTVVISTKPSNGHTPSKDATVCSSSPPIPRGVKQKSIPKVPMQFSAHIECVIVDKNFTTDLNEYYDDINNRGAVHQLESGSELEAWYDYKTNEFIAYYMPTKQCFVQTLSTSDQRYLFGYTKDGSTGKIFSAGKVLHMAEPGLKQVYMGLKSYRGIAVDTWQSCQHWEVFNATMNVTWYFTAPTEWDTAVGQVVPVGAYVIGNVWDSAVKFRRVEHYYNLFRFRLEIDIPTVFETPAGVQCPGRKNTKPLPAMPNVFSFTSEKIDKKRQTISFMQEFYDYERKLVMYNFRPLQVDSNPFGTNTLREIHDFNTGVAYVTDTMHGNCTAKKIELTFDDRSVDRNHVSMRNSAQFFYFDLINYTYEGVVLQKVNPHYLTNQSFASLRKSIRNIDCDSWVGIRANWPSKGINSTWMWYFATPGWTQMNTGHKQSGTPVRLIVDAPDAGIHYEYNMYNFVKNNPNPLYFDISGCYVNRTRRRFQLNFPGDFVGVVSNNMNLFKYFMLKSLAKQLQLSTLRVSNLQVFMDQDIIVTFELLDVSPLIGDVHHIVEQTSLQKAGSILIDLIKKNRFVVSLDDPAFKNIVGLIPKQTEFLETTNLTQNSANAYEDGEGKGKSPGTMAAVGVSMSIFGGILGSLCSYLWKRYF